jgi:hypothetical protein
MEINFNEKQTSETIANYLIPHHEAAAAVFTTNLFEVPFDKCLPGKTLYIIVELDEENRPEDCESNLAVQDVLLVGYNEETGAAAVMNRSGEVVETNRILFTDPDEAIAVCDLLSIRQKLLNYKRDCFKGIRQADKIVKHIDNFLGIES